MEYMIWKIRISFLWIFMAVAMSAHSLLALMELDIAEQMWATEMGGGMLVLLALFCWLIPLSMAVLTVTLNDTTNRWTNLVLGIVFTLFNIYHLIEHLTTALAIHQILVIGSTIVVTALVAWLAWKWPKQVIETDEEDVTDK
jgi:hypothetical protein